MTSCLVEHKKTGEKMLLHVFHILSRSSVITLYVISAVIFIDKTNTKIGHIFRLVGLYWLNKSSQQIQTML